MNYDVKCLGEIEETPKAIVGWLLMASWIYYQKPNMAPLLSDHCYDKLCKDLLKTLEENTHKYVGLISEEDLKAGSLYSLGSYDYPKYIIHFAEELSDKL